MDKQLWDIFISHASEDKGEIARPLANALRQAGLRVWYDEFILKLGDSISDLIREGQNKSTYALIILSPNFFANEKWARHELKGFITREVYEGKTIIPVWHKVTQQDVRRFAPDLADKMAVSTSRGLDVVVQEIVSLFKTKGEEGVGQIEEPVILERVILRSEPLILERFILRSEPLTVLEKDAVKEFGVKKVKFGWRPLKYIQNEYKNQGEVVFDRVTGLLWQKSGSTENLMYKDAQKYVEELNRQQFAGYENWRLPTIPELMSLLEPEKKNEDLYIDPIFDKEQRDCWSADRLPEGKECPSGAAWFVDFHDGHVHRGRVGHRGGLNRLSYVRCVHSRRAP